MSVQGEQLNNDESQGKQGLEHYRKPNELPHHWQLRKEFIETHAAQLEPERLVCLSNVFVNVECMGLTYPSELMKEIKELGSKVKGLEQYRYELERDEPEPPRRQTSSRGSGGGGGGRGRR